MMNYNRMKRNTKNALLFFFAISVVACHNRQATTDIAVPKATISRDTTVQSGITEEDAPLSEQSKITLDYQEKYKITILGKGIGRAVLKIRNEETSKVATLTDEKYTHWIKLKMDKSKEDYWPESPLYYDAPCQFLDVDFDGKKELLINDFYDGQGGNNYQIYYIRKNNFIPAIDLPNKGVLSNTDVINRKDKTWCIFEKDGVFEEVYFTYKIGRNTQKTFSQDNLLQSELGRELMKETPCTTNKYYLVKVVEYIQGEMIPMKRNESDKDIFDDEGFAYAEFVHCRKGNKLELCRIIPLKKQPNYNFGVLL